MKHFPQSLVLLKKNTIKISLEPHTHTHIQKKKKKKNPLSRRQIVINNLIDKTVILVVESDKS